MRFAFLVDVVVRGLELVESIPEAGLVIGMSM
jgi:hypothetical protein